MKIARNTRTGFTISELMVSISIMSLIFSFMAYLIFMSSRNAVNVHDQVISQTQATSAAERLAQTLRNACFFSPVAGDDPAGGPLPRARFAWPGPLGTPDTPQWGVVQFVKEADAGKVQIFMDEAKVNGKPDYEYSHINNFTVQFETASRMTLSLFYHYSGFGLKSRTDSNNDGIPDNALTGQFITDIIAKNHHVGEGIANYGETTATIARL